MALTGSGAITLDAMHVEAGGTTGDECSINDADIIGLIGKTAGATMAFNEWYGASGEFYSFEISNSLRQNAGDSAYLHKSQGLGNRRTFTISFWVKRSRQNDRQAIFSATVDGSNECFIWFDTTDELFVKENTSGSTNFEIRTNRKFRDPSAWYHIVVAYDTTNGTAGNRVRFYVNGVEETSFANETQPDENFQTKFNDGSTTLNIGRMNYDSEYFGGYLAEVVLIDGLQLAPTSFGEFGEDSGIWKPIDVSGLTFGTNGFYFEFKGSGTSANSSGLGADTSGNDHHFTVTNLTAVDQSTDTCTNNFATWNSLIKTTSTLSEGNLKYAQPGSNPVFGSLSTIGVTAGKWYAELNYTSGSNHKLVLGVADETFQNGNTTASYDLGKSSTTSSIAYVVNTGDYRVNNSNTSWGSGGGDGQIINMAIDRDNGKIYFGVNGTWGNSSDPAAGSGGIPTTALDSSTNWFWGITADTSGTSDVGELNFGSPSYSESGGETDGNGYGNFANAVPSGYYVLNSKNLAEYG